MTDDATVRLRDALERTLAQGSARFILSAGSRGTVTISEPGPVGAGGVSRAAAAAATAIYALAVAVAMEVATIADGRQIRRRRAARIGTIRFAPEAYVKPGRLPANSRSSRPPDVDYLDVAGRRFAGKTGRWFELPRPAAGYGSPFWYLEVAGAAVEVADRGSIVEDRVRYRLLSATCDFTAASAQRELRIPAKLAAVDLRRLALEVRLDREGRVACIDHLVIRGELTDRRRVEFFDFGVGAEIREPLPAELTDVDPRRPRRSVQTAR